MPRAESNADATSVRQQYIFPASLAQTVEERAKRQGVTKSEYVRRAIEAHDPELDSVTEADLAELLQQLRAAVHDTTTRVDAALARIERWPAERAADRVRAREEALAWAEAHSEAVEGMDALLGGRV